MGQQTVSKVIDLRTRSTYQPDYATLARTRLLMARTSLDMSHGEFAAMLTPLIGWPVSAEAAEAWETTVVPPGDVLVAISAITPAAADRLGIRSHKFIAVHIGADAVTRLIAEHPAEPTDDRIGGHKLRVEHPSGDCHLHVWPFGAAVFHLVEDLDLPNIAALALWRVRSYEENLTWATTHLRTLTGDDTVEASYVLSLYWLHTPIWAGRMLDTALRIISSPRILIDKSASDGDERLRAAEHAERSLLGEGYDGGEMRPFGLMGVSAGYASWSGVAYHPCDLGRALPEADLVSCELATQAIWGYCEHINRQVEQGHEPHVPDGFGWRFLRGAKSRLTIPRPQETGQHRVMRDAILETSGLITHLDQAIDALKEAQG